MSTRTYRTPVDADGKAVPRDRAVAIRVSIYEVIYRDGTESLLDEYDIPINRQEQPA